MVRPPFPRNLPLCQPAPYKTQTNTRNTAVWGIGGRPILYGADQLLAREGSTPGANTWAESRGDGFDWAITVNTRDYAPRADGQDPFVDILCNVTMSAFLDANPML